MWPKVMLKMLIYNMSRRTKNMMSYITGGNGQRQPNVVHVCDSLCRSLARLLFLLPPFFRSVTATLQKPVLLLPSGSPLTFTHGQLILHWLPISVSCTATLIQKHSAWWDLYIMLFMFLLFCRQSLKTYFPTIFYVPAISFNKVISYITGWALWHVY